MATPIQYRAEFPEGRYPRVVDEQGKWLCDCADEATATRIAEALKHLSAYECEHEPLSAEEVENLGRMLDESDRLYRAEHPEYDPNANPLVKALGV